MRGPFTLTCDDPACPRRRTNLICARGRAALWRAAGTPRRAARRRDRSDEAHSDAGRARRRQQRRGRGAARARAAVARRSDGNGCTRSPPRALGADVPYFLEGGAVLGLERGDLLFRCRAAAGVGGAGAAGFRRQHEGRVRVVRRATSGEAARPRGRPRTSLVNDLEAPVVPRAIPKSAVSFRHSGGPGRPGGDVGQRLGRIRPVFSRVQRRSAPQERAASASRRTLVTRTLNHQTYQRLAAT